MDRSKNSIFPNEFDLQSAPDAASAAADASSADLASSRNLVAGDRQPRSDQSTPWQSDPSDNSSTVVYCGSEAEVHDGFLIALKLIGIAVVEEPVGPSPYRATWTRQIPE